MEMSDEIQLLRDKDVYPNAAVLIEALGTEVFEVYEALMNISDELEFCPEWRYYNDGKSWLCKVSYKKKTIFWLSIWNKSIKVSSYFTLRTAPGILELDLPSEVSESFRNVRPIGKLIPFVYDITKREDLVVFQKVAVYKQKNL
jgi:hypothetical protein